MISIPNPCPEKIGNMSPVAGGNFCGKCTQTVFDFTNFSNEKIIAFLSEKKGEKVCGQIRTIQLSSRKSVLSKFLAAIAIAFTPVIFASCGNEDDYKVGDVAYESDSTEIANSKQDSSDESLQEKPYQLSKEDSTKVADSISQTKNPIRDFK